MEGQYEIWSEGFEDFTGKGKAIYFGKSQGKDFKDACIKLAERDPRFEHSFDEQRMTWWSCKLFDNEEQARKNFG